MFVDFLYELRKRKVPVGTQEAVALSRALAEGLHESSLDGFYDIVERAARAAESRGLELSRTTRVNLRSMGITVAGQEDKV